MIDGWFRGAGSGRGGWARSGRGRLAGVGEDGGGGERKRVIAADARVHRSGGGQPRGKLLRWRLEVEEELVDFISLSYGKKNRVLEQ